MATIAQIQANRQNATKSTGPTSDAGKARSGQNRLSHGLFAEELVLSQFGESQQEFDDSLSELQDYFKPTGPIEKSLVAEIAAAGWRHNRALRLETAYFNHWASGLSEHLASTNPQPEPPTREDHNAMLSRVFADQSPIFNRFSIYAARLARSRDQAVTRLTRLQNDRRKREAAAQTARPQPVPATQPARNQKVTENSRNEPNSPPAPLPFTPTSTNSTAFSSDFDSDSTAGGSNEGAK